MFQVNLVVKGFHESLSFAKRYYTLWLKEGTSWS